MNLLWPLGPVPYFWKILSWQIPFRLYLSTVILLSDSGNRFEKDKESLAWNLLEPTVLFSQSCMFTALDFRRVLHGTP